MAEQRCVSIPKDIDFFLSLAAVDFVEEASRGVIARCGTEYATIDVVRPDVLKVAISAGGVFDTHPTEAVVTDDFGEIPYDIVVTKDRVTITTAALKAIVSLRPFSLDVFRSDGSPVAQSAKERGILFLNDAWAVARKRTRDDRFFGLGQKTGRFNRDGRQYVMHNEDIILEQGIPSALSVTHDPYYISIPLLYHMTTSNGMVSASFFDNAYPMRFDLDNADHWRVICTGGCMTEYIFAGPTIASILARFSELTGRMPAPPIWALGHHQCRWYNYREEDIRALASTYREKEIPCDSLWLDIDYMDDFRIFTWDDDKYPDPACLVADLERDGFKTVTIIDPGVKKDDGYSVYTEGSAKGYFCRTYRGKEFVGKVWPGHTVFPDFARPETRAWWSGLIAEHMKNGLAGIWIDMNEPAAGRVDERTMLFDGGQGEHDRWRNRYGLLMAMATCEGIRTACPGERTFVLSRSGFAGIQRYAANWMGDNASRWEHLAMSIPMCSGMSVSGQPFVGCDIGGFAENVDAELLVRWYQLAAFQPFFRNHSIKDCVDQYPWSFGSETERLIRAAIETRYRLLPYLYSAFMTSTETGEPVIRPLLYDFPDDTAVWDIDNQFMMGQHILVAPVVKRGAVRRRVYLPIGWWYEMETGRSYKGGKWIVANAPLDQCPVYVRAGAVIPVLGLIKSTVEYAQEDLILDCYPPVVDCAVESQLHEDDGVTEAWKEGCFLRTMFSSIRSGDEWTLSGKICGKGYEGFRRKRFRIRVYNESMREIIIENDGADFSCSMSR